nr:MAG TPA: hypothetical protein [Bacteriophage sp.]
MNLINQEHLLLKLELNSPERDGIIFLMPSTARKQENGDRY